MHSDIYTVPFCSADEDSSEPAQPAHGVRHSPTHGSPDRSRTREATAGEFASMSRPEIEKPKAFTTRRVDRFRPSYGRRVIEVPRQTVLFGTTNSDTYLKDETG